MPESAPESTGVEAMAFQVVLSKLGALQEEMQAMQRTVQQMLPLLTKIVGLLEAQGQQPEVPVATYEQHYAELQPSPESESAPTHVVGAPKRPLFTWAWFTRREPDADQ
jgi:hypothetical protein